MSWKQTIPRIAAAFLALGAATAVAMQDDLVVEITPDQDLPEGERCGRDCGTGWAFLFQCLDGGKCCGWYNCIQQVTYGGCCYTGTVCNRNVPYPNWGCQAEP